MIGAVSNWMTFKAGCCGRGPTPYAAAYMLFRIDDRRGGAGIDAPHAARGGIGRAPGEPGGRHLGKRRSQFSGPQSIGCAARHLSTAFLRSFSRVWLRAPKVLGDTGESSPEHWEKPLGSADVHIVSLRSRRDAERLEAALARARKRVREISASPRSGARIVMRCRMKEEHSDSRTGSAIPRLKGRVFPAPIPMNGP